MKMINASAEMKAQACLNLSRMYVDAGAGESQDNPFSSCRSANRPTKRYTASSSEVGRVMNWLQTLGFIGLSATQNLKKASIDTLSEPIFQWSLDIVPDLESTSVQYSGVNA